MKKGTIREQIIDSRNIDWPGWFPEEYLCVSEDQDGFELSIKVYDEIDDYDRNEITDLSTYDDDGDLVKTDYKVPDVLNGQEVNTWEVSWDTGDLIIMSKNLVPAPLGEEPLKFDSEVEDKTLYLWLTETYGNKGIEPPKMTAELIKEIRLFIAGKKNE